MLAKMWKKILLAICIIACIYNVMSKIVNRHSLEENLNSANDGRTVFLFKAKENKKTTNLNTIVTTIKEATDEEKNAEKDDLQSETNQNASSENAKFKSLFNF